MSCPAKHVKVEIPDGEWKCPKCGRTADESRDRYGCFIIEEPSEDASDDCELLHEDDFAACECGFGATGKKLSSAYAKRLGLVTCSHCKGRGVIKP